MRACRARLLRLSPQRCTMPSLLIASNAHCGDISHCVKCCKE